MSADHQHLRFIVEKDGRYGMYWIEPNGKIKYSARSRRRKIGQTIATIKKLGYLSANWYAIKAQRQESLL